MLSLPGIHPSVAVAANSNGMFQNSVLEAATFSPTQSRLIPGSGEVLSSVSTQSWPGTLSPAVPLTQPALSVLPPGRVQAEDGAICVGTILHGLGAPNHARHLLPLPPPPSTIAAYYVRSPIPLTPGKKKKLAPPPLVMGPSPASRRMHPTVDSVVSAVGSAAGERHCDELAPASFKVTASGNFVQGVFKMNMHGLGRIDGCCTSGSGPSAHVATQANAPLQKLSLEQLELGRCLGRGASAVVYFARHKATGQLLALKKLGIHSAEERRVLLAELKALVAVSTPFLVHLYDAFFDGDCVYMALEYMDAGTLEQVIQARGRMPAAVAAVVATHLTQGLLFLAHVQRLHRDFKPGNCLCSTTGVVKLSDFGLSRSLSLNAPVAGTFLGTAVYMSPERLKGESYSFASDVWALGLTILEAITAEPPFRSAADFFALTLAACNGPVVPAGLPADLSDWLSRCLQHDPKQRATASELLAHRWLQRHSVQGECPLREWLSFLL